jgi:hypothetical protein
MADVKPIEDTPRQNRGMINIGAGEIMDDLHSL